MKQINGTFSLAYVDEDNKQRVIFRVIPLITREGVVFRNGKELFPDEAGLRVVPDKREQSTFKERMRAMGNLCVIDLASNEGRELLKVRQNKNYDPAQGEKNQWAIYSDVILEFAPGAAFEVLDWQEGGVSLNLSRVITPEILLLYNKVLYGPLARDCAATAIIGDLKPFGNDRFLLHTVELPDGQAHTVYWNPEETVTWRQRRGSLRRKIEKTQCAEEPMAEPAQQDTVKEPADETLPIGARLEILEPGASFEEQMNRLDQPISEGANRLSDEEQHEEAYDLRESASRFTGTPLTRSIRAVSRSISRPEPLHHVVEQQLRVSHDERMGAELVAAQYCPVENPAENLLRAVEQAWQDKEAWSQAIEALADNDGFVQSILEALHRKGNTISAVAVAYKQLENLEAERFHALLQLEKALEDRKSSQEELIARATAKKREELSRLTQSLEASEQKAKELENLLCDMSRELQGRVDEIMKERITGLGGISEESVLISPVLGKHQSVENMAESVFHRLNANGFHISMDDALCQLIVFSQFPCFCLRAYSIADAQRYAAVLLEALGLHSSHAAVGPRGTVRVASLLREDERRAPTASMQSVGTEALSLFGHRTIFLADPSVAFDPAQWAFRPYPILRIPHIHQKDKAAEGMAITVPAPASLSSFSELSAEASPLLEEGERWFDEMRNHMNAANALIPDAVFQDMRRFVSVACQKSGGGFLDAADRAVHQWIVPQVTARQVDTDKVRAMFKELPRSLEALTEENAPGQGPD